MRMPGTRVSFRWDGREKPMKPARCELEQTKWMIENQTGEAEITAEMNQVVYVVGCIGATIKVHKKCKSLIVDRCKKTNVIFEKCLSTVEVVNCKWVKRAAVR